MDDDAYHHLELIRDGDVLHVVIDREGDDLNTVDDALHHDLTRLFRELKQEDQARAVLLSGRGRAFSAGGDFEWFKTLRTPRRAHALHRDAKQLIWDLLDVELPIVAAVHGYAMGLGASIALFCDVIYVADDAKLADPHVRAGIVAGDGGTVAWPLAIGPALAKEHLMTGDPVSAVDAARLGLVNHVVPEPELLDAAMACARRLAAGAPMAVRYTKIAVNKLVKQALGTAFDSATAFEMTTLLSEDHVEAVDAFLTKRTPRFVGR